MKRFSRDETLPDVGFLEALASALGMGGQPQVASSDGRMFLENFARRPYKPGPREGLVGDEDQKRKLLRADQLPRGRFVV